MSASNGPSLPHPDDEEAWDALMAQMRQVFTVSGESLHDQQGPVNWELARRIASTVRESGEKEPEVTTEEHTAVTGALRLADLWLEEFSTFPSGVQTVEAWTRAEWIEATETTWHSLVNPVAEKVVAAMGHLLPTTLDPEDEPQTNLLKQLTEPFGGLSAAFAQIGGVVFGVQTGQALGTLAGEVLTSTEIGLPLGPAGTAALLPTNVTLFGEGLERPIDQVRLYVALRETAHHRLYQHIPWLRGHVLEAIAAYARGIHIDQEAFRDAVERAQDNMDPENPQSMQMVLAENMFRPAATEEQLTALARLELALALVEGWVTHVTDEAASEHIPGVDALSETFRRRRAAGGPAEQTFANLVGLELRPRKLREATTLWTTLTQQRGIEGRDDVWAHPDLLPTAEDLDDPEGFAARERGVDIPGFDEL